MSGYAAARILAREALAVARSQPAASAVTVLLVAGLLAAIMLTTGRAVAVERDVLASLDAAGTRTIIVRAGPTAGVTGDVVDRIAAVEGVEWVGGLTGAEDAVSSVAPGGAAVPMRTLIEPAETATSLLPRTVVPRQAFASAEAARALGLVAGAGTVMLGSGHVYAVAVLDTVPPALESFEPLLLSPRAEVLTIALSTVVVVAERADLVGAVGAATSALLAPLDPAAVSIETSERLATLRGLVENQLSGSSRSLVLAMLGTTGVLVAVVLAGLVAMRRKDDGRRRALGATRSLVIGILLMQTLLLTVLGAAVGIAVSFTVLAVTASPFPSADFVAAVVVLAIATTAVAASAPALVASRRDPMRELRVP